MQAVAESGTRAVAAGSLLLGALLLSIANGLGLHEVDPFAGAFFWAAGLLLAVRLGRLQRVQTVVMLIAGGLGLVYGATAGGRPDWLEALAGNQALLAMLASVSFLRLISRPTVERGEHDPQGREALWRTLLGVHLFGAVINLSAVMILGDRQSRRAPMTPLQASVLSRGFAMAAYWSPFFAAMGIALSHAPGASLPVLSLVGLPLAATGLLLSAWQLGHRPGVSGFIGYPMHFGALWIPGLLAVLVLSAHSLVPGVPVLTVICGASLLLVTIVLALRDPGAAGRRLAGHVVDGLPTMSGELALFLAAGVLAAGIGTVVDAVGWSLALDRFGATEAGAMLVMMVLLSIVGVHPVISIATAQGLLAPLSPDPNLLGITYLMAWGTGVSISPFSGMHLAMQGRFGVDAHGFLRWNGSFTVLMLVVHLSALQLYEAFVAA